MPRLDLRNPEKPTAFHKLAAFMMLSIILWPYDRAMRTKFMARLERDTGLTPKRKPRLKSDEIVRRQEFRDRLRGLGIGGFLAHPEFHVGRLCCGAASA
jgi:hypothetical protein